MPPILDRRRLIAAVPATMAALALPRLAAAQDSGGDGRVMGDVALGAEDASVTIYEYASFTCPHCASFHINTWPEVKEQYVDTGKVRFILREVYFDAYGLWASMLARCAGEDAFYPMAEAFLKQQSEWTRAEDIAAALQKIGRINGLSSEEMRACLSDKAYAEALVARYQENAEEHEIRSTPAFVIDGEIHTGDMRFDEFSALIEGALGS